jgi:hypothetical protein
MEIEGLQLVHPDFWYDTENRRKKNLDATYLSGLP